MTKFVFALVMTLAAVVGIFAQAKPAAKYEAEIALANLAVNAHGGDKLRAMNSLVVRGAVDVTTSAFNQQIPATFVIILAKEKYRFEIANPFQPIKEVFDGVNKSTTIRGGMSLPPVNRLGFPVLPMVGQTGFVITPLPAEKKKKRGFRMTSPEGYYTDFYLDEKTNQIKGYDSQYDINGRIVTTSVEVDKMRVVDGISIPEKYSQRFDTEQITIYADFKAKEILVNSALDADIFSTGN